MLLPSLQEDYSEFSHHISTYTSAARFAYMTKPSCKESWSFTCVTIPPAKIKFIFVKELEKLFNIVLLLGKIFCLYFRTFSLVQQDELRNNGNQAPYSSSIDSQRFSFWLQESNIPYCYKKYNSSHNITKRNPHIFVFSLNLHL